MFRDLELWLTEIGHFPSFLSPHSVSPWSNSGIIKQLYSVSLACKGKNIVFSLSFQSFH